MLTKIKNIDPATKFVVKRVAINVAVITATLVVTKIVQDKIEARTLPTE